MTDETIKSKSSSNSKAIMEEPHQRMKNLVGMSSKIEIDRQIPVERYFKSGRELVKTAKHHEEQGEIEKAFVLHLRYVTLFLEKLVHHPGYPKADQEEKNQVKSQCKSIIDLAEGMKGKIMAKYQQEYDHYRSTAGSQQQSTSSSNSDSTAPGEHAIRKRSLDQGEVPTSTSDTLQDLDRKYDFSMTAAQRALDKEKEFDPFSLDDLNRKFDEIQGRN